MKLTTEKKEQRTFSVYIRKQIIMYCRYVRTIIWFYTANKLKTILNEIDTEKYKKLCHVCFNINYLFSVYQVHTM